MANWGIPASWEGRDLKEISGVLVIAFVETKGDLQLKKSYCELMGRMLQLFLDPVCYLSGATFDVTDGLMP